MATKQSKVFGNGKPGAVLNKTLAITIPSLTASGGMETYAVGLALGMQARGWDVHLIVTHDRGDRFDALKRNVSCHDLSGKKLSIGKIRQFALLANKIKPRVLIFNFSTLGHYALPYLDGSIKTVSVIHNDVDIFYRTSSLIARRTWRWVAPTPRIKSGMASHLGELDNGRVKVIPHGVDVRSFQVNLGPRTPSNRLVFVGSFLPHKGVDLLPGILSILVREFPSIHLHIVGDGGSRGAVQKHFEELRLSNNVTWEGKVAPGMVPQLLRDKDILIFPTRVEAFGLVIAEAMMAGVVPVVTRIEGLTDFIITHGQDGLLVEPENMRGFAEAIASLYRNPSLLGKLSLNASRSASSRFSSAKMLDAYEAMFDEADNRVGGQKASEFGALFEIIQALQVNWKSRGGLFELLRSRVLRSLPTQK